MRSGVSRHSVRSRRRWRMISCPAANEMRWVNPSMTTTSPSRTCRATASCMDSSLEPSAIGGGVSSIAHLVQALVDDPEGGVDVILIHDERGREPQRALPTAEEQEAFLEGAAHDFVGDVGRGLAGFAVLHEFHTNHESAPAHVSDHRVLVLE